MAILKDGRRGHYWTTDNIILDRYAKRLKPAGFLVYAALLRHSRARSCFPRIRYLVQTLGVSRSTILRAVRRIVSLGLVTVERDGRQNVYTIMDVPEPGPELEPEPTANGCQTGTNPVTSIGSGLTPISVPVCDLSAPRTIRALEQAYATSSAVAGEALREEQRALAHELRTVAPTLPVEQAEHLAASIPADRLRAAAAVVRQRIAGGAVRNPAGMLRTAIAEGWQPEARPANAAPPKPLAERQAEAKARLDDHERERQRCAESLLAMRERRVQ